MIPKIIHYCWFGRGQMPELVERCIASWKMHMPDWKYRLWDEEALAQALQKPTPNPSLKGREQYPPQMPTQCNNDSDWLKYMPQYVQEAYAAKKYAFVSDYVRLWALEQEGGVYIDTDVEVLRSFDPLLSDTAIIGLEESKSLLPGTCVIGCEAHCKWIKDMISTYDEATFLKEDGSLDMTTNVQRLGAKMVEGGLQHERKIQYLPQWGLRVYTHDYFSPITSTRVMRKTKNTYSIHRFAGSWVERTKWQKVKMFLLRKVLGTKLTDKLIQIKRRIFR